MTEKLDNKLFEKETVDETILDQEDKWSDWMIDIEHRLDQQDDDQQHPETD